MMGAAVAVEKLKVVGARKNDQIIVSSQGYSRSLGGEELKFEANEGVPGESCGDVGDGIWGNPGKPRNGAELYSKLDRAKDSLAL